MVYKPAGKGTWGLNIERVNAFILGEREINLSILKSPDGEIEVLETGTINEVKHLSSFLNSAKEYIAEYI